MFEVTSQGTSRWTPAAHPLSAHLSWSSANCICLIFFCVIRGQVAQCTCLLRIVHYATWPRVFQWNMQFSALTELNNQRLFCYDCTNRSASAPRWLGESYVKHCTTPGSDTVSVWSRLRSVKAMVLWSGLGCRTGKSKRIQKTENWISWLQMWLKPKKKAFSQNFRCIGPPLASGNILTDYLRLRKGTQDGVFASL